MAEAAPSPNQLPTGPAGEDLSVSMPESWRVAVERRTGPAQRIALIENSQRCLAHGWFSLVPLAGAFYVIPAVRMFLRVDRERAEWNPAAHLWLRGLVLASFGFWVNLLWWGALVLRWGVDRQFLHNPIDAIALAYLMLFGSIPAFFGLGFAAIRCPNAIGAFVLRRRWILSGLAGLGYLIVLQWLALAEWRHRQEGPDAEGWGPDPQPMFSVYWAIAVWLIWMMGGFVCVARLGAKSWWSVVWLAGAAWLTLWVAAN